ncbi:hypothetical protein MTR_1g067690 [Medicago truncatula]|uniref:Uncharacterized protein n=1 Tax=Medicago truncatula TaxID=3880 RepID=A0A072VWA1_MEDTR|nr:hypothetical protein MTR_1g067690 [Medicago truncatula]
MVEDIDNYSNHPLKTHKNDTIFIGWKIPRDGWIKLNCDGAYKDSLGLAGCGCLFWNSDGRWLKGENQYQWQSDHLNASYTRALKVELAGWSKLTKVSQVYLNGG